MMGSSVESLATVDGVLSEIIDEWYNKVSSFYLTAEEIAGSSNPDREEELKRFHDKNGHRIKFSKDELDFTYGLRAFEEDGVLAIEVSVNNKVKNFDITEFRRRLEAHYQKAESEAAPSPSELQGYSYGEIFQIGANLSESLTLEIREGKADIMRLAFSLNPDLLEDLVENPADSRQLVENFCVTPFRSIYASVYRRGG
jgi:hypothetical protein